MKTHLRWKLTTSFFFAFAMICLSTHTAFAQKDVPKIEFGPLYTLVYNHDVGTTQSGIGGRLTINPHWAVGLDVEISHYPTFLNKDDVVIPVGTLETDLTTGLFGVKVTPLRSDSAALFFKVRPGFAHVRVDGKGLPGFGDSRFSDTEFAVDFGGGVEVFLARWFGLRFDVADLYIRAIDEHKHLGENGLILGGSHNILFTAGVTFRF